MSEKDMEVIGWGTREEEFIEITDQPDSISDLYKNYFHACHCMLFANDSQLIIDEFKPKATVLMQMRFDGHFGFPGGLVDEGETLTEGLNRELLEEIGCPHTNCWNISMDDYISSHISHPKHLVVHFFIKELTFDELKQVENHATSAKDYGSEAMGLIRVPLFSMKDGFRGFPAFLSNNFIGMTKKQLISGLVLKGILTKEEVDQALIMKPCYVCDNSC